MKERPIIFSAPMVRAILDGRKTQTRRVVKPQPQHIEWFAHQDGWCARLRDTVPQYEMVACPYGVPSDRLWVRETHCVVSAGYQDGRGHRTMYRADDEWAPLRWTPSIHMPRWASRITLEITAVRVERLNQISVADCHAEGIPPTWDGQPIETESYERLWDSINGHRHPWASNPWVWVIEFKRLDAT